MILYHGSNVIVEHPKIITSEYGRDFGSGFYTTDIKDQAVRWARRRAKLSLRNGGIYAPYISIYEFDDASFDELNCKRFDQPDTEWLNLVCACRSDISFHHKFDIVVGKIADDNVGETISYVVQGIMRKEDAVERLRFEKINNQICFNTEKALSYLKYIGFEDCR